VFHNNKKEFAYSVLVLVRMYTQGSEKL
jgi:hypothetical protein